MNIVQQYRVRRIEMDSQNGAQTASLTFTPVAAEGQENTAGALPGRMGGGTSPGDFTISGIPLAAIQDVALDTVGTFVFTPAPQ